MPVNPRRGRMRTDQSKRKMLIKRTTASFLCALIGTMKISAAIAGPTYHAWELQDHKKYRFISGQSSRLYFFFNVISHDLFPSSEILSRRRRNIPQILLSLMFISPKFIWPKKNLPNVHFCELPFDLIYFSGFTICYNFPSAHIPFILMFIFLNLSSFRFHIALFFSGMTVWHKFSFPHFL